MHEHLVKQDWETVLTAMAERESADQAFFLKFMRDCKSSPLPKPLPLPNNHYQRSVASHSAHANPYGDWLVDCLFNPQRPRAHRCSPLRQSSLGCGSWEPDRWVWTTLLSRSTESWSLMYKATVPGRDALTARRDLQLDTWPPSLPFVVGMLRDFDAPHSSEIWLWKVHDLEALTGRFQILTWLDYDRLFQFQRYRRTTKSDISVRIISLAGPRLCDVDVSSYYRGLQRQPKGGMERERSGNSVRGSYGHLPPPTRHICPGCSWWMPCFRFRSLVCNYEGLPQSTVV